jgi:release factor glutamine methyltransferase
MKGQPAVWTIRELMKVSIAYLDQRGFSESRRNVELLLAFSLKLARIQVYTNFEKPLTPEEVSAFRTVFEERLKHKPLQHIIGSTGFMGLEFAVHPNVLIPRPETETLVEQVILAAKNFSPEGPMPILDIGTGAGNIAVSIAKVIKNADVTAIDINPDAITLAESNARRLGVDDRIRFHQLDIEKDIDAAFESRFQIIVSNPPYIPTAEWELLQPEVRDFEPRAALIGGNDGLHFHRRIITLAPYLLFPDGLVMLETGDGQTEAVMKLMDEAGYQRSSRAADLQGTMRVVIGTTASKHRGGSSV